MTNYEQESIKLYTSAVRRVVQDFLKKQLSEDEYDDFDYSDVYWVGGCDIGGVFEWADYWINFSDLVVDLTQDAPKGLFFEWYDYTMESEHNKINYRSWCMGLRPENEEVRKKKELAEAKERVAKAKAIFEQEMESYEKCKKATL